MALIETLYATNVDTTASPNLSGSVYTYTGSYLLVKLNNGASYHGDPDAVICPEGGAVTGLARNATSDHWSLRILGADYSNQGTFANFGGSDNWLKVVFGASDTLFYSGAAEGSLTLRYTDVGNAIGSTWDGKKLRLNKVLFDQVGPTPVAGNIALAQRVGRYPIGGFINNGLAR